jgi:hydrogenase expression/formation protein HypC
MCIAIPCRVTARNSELGTVEYSGNSREINLALVPQAGPGDWVLVHAGLALQVIEESGALETLALLGELNADRG